MSALAEALPLADELERLAPYSLRSDLDPMLQAANMLRTQHNEIERLNACIKWEQNRAERIGTHGPGCETYGPNHYECLLRVVERKDALLRQAQMHVASNIAMTSGDSKAEDLYGAITKELAK